MLDPAVSGMSFCPDCSPDSRSDSRRSHSPQAEPRKARARIELTEPQSADPSFEGLPDRALEAFTLQMMADLRTDLATIRSTIAIIETHMKRTSEQLCRVDTKMDALEYFINEW